MPSRLMLRPPSYRWLRVASLTSVGFFTHRRLLLSNFIINSFNNLARWRHYNSFREKFIWRLGKSSIIWLERWKTQSLWILNNLVLGWSDYQLGTMISLILIVAAAVLRDIVDMLPVILMNEILVRLAITSAFTNLGSLVANKILSRSSGAETKLSVFACKWCQRCTLKLGFLRMWRLTRFLTLILVLGLTQFEIM
jgi:hypothetical protein